MKKVFKWVGIGFGILVLLVLIVPLIIPVPPLEGIKPVSELVDADSRFLEIEALQVHYKVQGEGENTALVLLHGFGASVFSWREVMTPLAENHFVMAYDRPAFGFTTRPDLKDWQGENPYAMSFQDDLLIGLMDAMDLQQAVLVGNSMGGTVAFTTALEHPERVIALILVDPALGVSRSAAIQQFFFNLPQVQRWGPWFVRSIANSGNDTIRLAWHDPTKIGEEVFVGYRKPLQSPNWDQALWDLTLARSDQDLLARAGELKMPVLVITGDDDRIIPTESTIQAASQMPNAKLIVIENCGHVPQEECPEAFLQAVNQFLDELGGE